MNPGATVYVVDDDPDVLKSLERLFDSVGFAVVGFPSPGSFLERFDRTVPGCIVLDLAMPGLNGLELQRELESQGVALPIIFLTGHGDIATSVHAMKRGAADFLTKPVDDDVLIAAVRDAIARDRKLRAIRAEHDRVAESLAALTAREREVLALVVAGRLNKQIAAELGTVEKTIKFHRANLMRKLGVRTFADLVKLAQAAGVGANPEA